MADVAVIVLSVLLGICSVALAVVIVVLLRLWHGGKSMGNRDVESVRHSAARNSNRSRASTRPDHPSAAALTSGNKAIAASMTSLDTFANSFKVEFSELELDRTLGRGSYGVVYKA
eukprot:Colp12_sorted_trinity150504_noHs@17288